MNGKSNESTSPTREQIAERAFQIWEEEGRPRGQEAEHWLRAERELASASSNSQERNVPPRQAQTARRRKPALADERAFRIFQ